MRHKKVGLSVALLVLVLSAVLGATVLREPIAFAATPFQNVFVANTPSDPVPVTSLNDPARNAFAFFKNDQMAAGESQHLVSFTVPANKRLVIESVSGYAGLATGEKLTFVGIQASVNAKIESYVMPAVFSGVNPAAAIYRDLWAATDTVKLYADGGTAVNVFWTRNVASTNEANLNVSIQGYLIDCVAAACQ